MAYVWPLRVILRKALRAKHRQHKTDNRNQKPWDRELERQKQKLDKNLFDHIYFVDLQPSFSIVNLWNNYEKKSFLNASLDKGLFERMFIQIVFDHLLLWQLGWASPRQTFQKEAP